MHFNIKFIYLFIILTSCSSDDIVQYFEYPDHNVLNIGAQLTDLHITNDSNTLIVADKGNNRVIFIDTMNPKMTIKKSIWVGSEPTTLEITDDEKYLLVGLQGASNICLIGLEELTVLGYMELDEDGVFDLEFVSSKQQIIVSFFSSQPSDNKTKIYGWNPINIDTGELNLILDNDLTYNEITTAGYIALSENEDFLYVIDKYEGSPYNLLRYSITDDGFVPFTIIESSNIADVPITLYDLEYIPEFGIAVAMGGTDLIDGNPLDHAPIYALDNLTHIANLDLGSTPIALAYDPMGQHIYISPTDVDDNGMFIVEFSMETMLQTNYYQVAGILGSHSLIVDPQGEFIYAVVDDLSDQDTHEPYNGNSFNIQKIEITPEGTFPINNF